MASYHRRSKSIASSSVKTEDSTIYKSVEPTPVSPVQYLNAESLASNDIDDGASGVNAVTPMTIPRKVETKPILPPPPPSLIPLSRNKNKKYESSSSSSSESESSTSLPSEVSTDKIDLLNETKDQKKERKAKEKAEGKAEVDKLLKKQKKKINKCISCLIIPIGGILLLKRVVESLF